jgi:hypothetical protein
VERHIPAKGVDALGHGETPKRVVDCVGGEIRILPDQERCQPIAENDFLKRSIELDTVDVAITETLQPFDGGELKLSFAAPVRHEPWS